VELIEADETPAVVIVRWPSKPTVLHPHRFPASADTAVRTFAAAVVRDSVITTSTTSFWWTSAEPAMVTAWSAA
jgi:hypothetical protein